MNKKNLITTILSLFLLLTFLSACSIQAEKASEPKVESTEESQVNEEKIDYQRFSAQFMGPFDTVTTVMGYSEDEESFQKVVNRIQSELERGDHLFTIYDKYPEVTSLKEVNENASKEAVEVDPLVIEFLQRSLEISKESEGKLNIAMGAVLKLWHDAREPELHEPPKREMLEEGAKHINPEDLVLDPKENTIFFNDPEMSLDVGAVAKGMMVEKIAQDLKEDEIQHYLISAGGNVRAIGPKPDGSPWIIGVRNPEGPEADFLDTVEIMDGSVVTSGIYERYFEYEGRIYHHIIDPDTLEPTQLYRSLTVICEDSGIADALSTSLFIMDEESGDQLAEKFDAAVLRQYDDSGKIVGNPKWQEYKKED